MITGQVMPSAPKITRKLALHTDCSNHLHSYYKSPFTENGTPLCRCCQTTSVKWELVQSRNLSGLERTTRELRKEWWRNYWWETEIAPSDLEKAKNICYDKLKENVIKRIRSSVGKVYAFNGKIQPFNDGYQTPYSGNIVYYAQHAMATCCRFCIDYWHGIPQGRALHEDEVLYLSAVTNFYIEKKLQNE